MAAGWSLLPQPDPTTRGQRATSQSGLIMMGNGSTAFSGYPFSVRRVRIANRGGIGLGWRIALAVLAGAPLAAPQLAAVVGVTAYRRYARGVPAGRGLQAAAGDAPRDSRSLAQDGTLLAELPFAAGIEAGRRDWLACGELPARLRQAILAAEDVRFFEHAGVDLRAVARAAW